MAFRSDQYLDEAGTGSPDFPEGLTVDPANLTDAQAAKMELKQYVHGVDFTATSQQGGTIDFIYVIPYQLKNGTWRGKIQGSITGHASASFNIIRIPGTDINTAGVQPFVALDSNGGYSEMSASTRATDGSTAVCRCNGTPNFTQEFFYGDIEFASKPTFVD